MPTLINAQPDKIFPIIQPLANAAPVPTKIPPKKAVTVCSGGLASSLACPLILAEVQEPAIKLVTSRTSHQETF